MFSVWSCASAAFKIWGLFSLMWVLGFLLLHASPLMGLCHAAGSSGQGEGHLQKFSSFLPPCLYVCLNLHTPPCLLNPSGPEH